MSGHSKWSQIKHKKGLADKRKGAQFSKLVNTIAIAAREGGEDPDSNFRLRLAIDKAREANMPKENVERAIDKGAGKLEGSKLEEVTFEGFGPNDVAFIVKAVTDNKNRANAEIKSIFNKNSGHLGGVGSVSWMFQNLGLIRIENIKNKEEIELAAIDAGALDLSEEGSTLVLYTSPRDLMKVRDALSKYNITSAELSMEPKNMVKISDRSSASSILKLADDLDSHPEVVAVYSNFDIPDELISQEGTL
jgi:YebC/PmpR family DNA-binding regulatory protein